MGQGERSKPQSIGEFLFNELRQAFQDVRQKVLEEGWFGRVVSAAPVIEMEREQPPAQLGALGDRRPSFEEMWATHEPQSPAELSHGIDIDR